MGEKYDGIRACWNSVNQTLYLNNITLYLYKLSNIYAEIAAYQIRAATMEIEKHVSHNALAQTCMQVMQVQANKHAKKTHAKR